MDFIEIFESKTFFSLLSTMYASLFILATLRLLFHSNKRRKLYKEREQTAFLLLERGYEQKTLNEVSVRLIYNRTVSKIYSSSDKTFIDFLENFLIYIRKKDGDGSLTTDIEKLINPILEVEKAEKPYSGINEGERRILLAIDDSISKYQDSASIKRHLTDLSVLIDNNHKSLVKSEKTNKWTIPTSIVSVILTLLFGFYGLFGSSLSNKDIESITENVSKQVIMAVDSVKQKQTVSTLDIDTINTIRKETEFIKRKDYLRRRKQN